MCYSEIMNVNTVANQTDFFKRERQNFKEEVSNHYRKKFWVIAILKTVHKKKGLEPSIHPFFSMQRLQYVDEMSYKLERGLKEVEFNEIYDEWTKILREKGVYHPIWNHEDLECVKTMISGNNASRMLLEEILSFRTEELAFSYECMGFTHQDIDIIFDWMRTTPDERFMAGLDEVDGVVVEKTTLKKRHFLFSSFFIHHTYIHTYVY